MPAHRCHACREAYCLPKHLACRACWSVAPAALKAALYREYRPGQEERKVRPTKAYFLAARAVIAAIREVLSASKKAA